MAGEHHRHAGVGVLAQDAAEDVDADGVEAGERLVEHQQLRVVHERGGELHALLVAERELLHPLAGALLQPEALDPAVGRGLGVRARDAVQPGEVDELVADAHLRVQAALLGHVAEPRAGRGVGGRGRGTAPARGPARSTPRTMRMVVVLPAPLGPTKPNI